MRAAEARLAKSLLKAPMDGVVALRTVNVGDRVENMGNNTPAFRIVDNRLLDLTVAVPATRLAQVKVGQPLEFTTDAVPGRTFSGKVMFINPALDEASRSARVIAEVPNPDGLLRGGSSSRDASSSRSARACCRCRARRCSTGISNAGRPRSSSCTGRRRQARGADRHDHGRPASR